MSEWSVCLSVCLLCTTVVADIGSDRIGSDRIGSGHRIRIGFLGLAPPTPLSLFFGGSSYFCEEKARERVWADNPTLTARTQHQPHGISVCTLSRKHTHPRILTSFEFLHSELSCCLLTKIETGMPFIYRGICVVLAVTISISFAGVPVFDDFVRQYKKVYADESELSYRRSIYEKNSAYIRNFNRRKNRTFTMSMNSFGDLTFDEFASLLTGSRSDGRGSNSDLPLLTAGMMQDELVRRQSLPKGHALEHLYHRDRAQPTQLDWRTNNVVTPVKNQGKCGSCWSFSTTGTIESMWAICHALGRGGGPLVSLSEQELVDCDTGNSGCNGGNPREAIMHVFHSGGLASEASYPYVEENGPTPHQCTASKPPVVNITGGWWLYQGEINLYNGLYTWGPISVMIQVVQSFQFYKSGIYQDMSCTGSDINHAILAVGYGDQGSEATEYWIVKNSWGESWGNGGYGLMRRGVGSFGVGQGMCGIAIQTQTACVCSPLCTKQR